jgi:hypothetical protein
VTATTQPTMCKQLRGDTWVDVLATSPFLVKFVIINSVEKVIFSSYQRYFYSRWKKYKEISIYCGDSHRSYVLCSKVSI